MIADSLYSSADFRKAAVEYERVVYLTNDYLTTNRAVYHKAMCYKALGEYSRARTQLQRISYYGISDSLQFICHFESALCSFLDGKFEDTHSQLLQIKQFTKDSILLDDVYLLEGLNYNELGDFRNANGSLNKYLDKHYNRLKADSLKNILSYYYTKKALPHFKSRKLAGVLEYLPGLGLVYSGYPVLGTLNFLLNAACLSAGIYEVYYGYYFTGYFVGAALLSKFYLGGRNLTTKMIVKRNYLEKRRFNDKIRSVIQEMNQ